MRQSRQQSSCSAASDRRIVVVVRCPNGAPRRFGLWRAARDRMAAPAARN
ncbi:MAG TPA: hypothetical protein VFZ66_01715 [Herpetosiphonaceae bacterium]